MIRAHKVNVIKAPLSGIGSLAMYLAAMATSDYDPNHVYSLRSLSLHPL
jgi:hypothetical protein